MFRKERAIYVLFEEQGSRTGSEMNGTSRHRVISSWRRLELVSTWEEGPPWEMKRGGKDIKEHAE
jgi:hypothetical protein